MTKFCRQMIFLIQTIFRENLEGEKMNDDDNFDSEILKIRARIISGESSARAEVEAAFAKFRETENLHALLEILPDSAFAKADAIDAQIKKLREYFAQQNPAREIIEINEGAETDSGLPSTDAIGQILHRGDFHLDPVTNLLLFTAQRKELWDKKIAPILALDGIVLASRNWWSTLAYQGYAQGVSRKLIENMTREFLPARYIRPDKSVILTIDDETRVLRTTSRSADVANDTFDSRENDFFAKANAGYFQIAKEFGVEVVDAGGTIDGVFAGILAGLKLK